jgi:cell shape-determining protein MreC
MKKIYLARRNALVTAQGVSWGVGALLFSIVVLGVRVIAPNVFWQAFAPLFHISDVVTEGGHTFLAHFGDAAVLGEQNEKLAAQNAALAIENERLEQQVADQESLLGSSPGGTPGIVAGVVARPPTSPYDTLVLGRGSRQGVIRGMEAFGSGGTPIGVVASVTNDFSRVVLFSTPGVATNGWVGRSSLPLSLIGAGAGAFHASVPRDAKIAVGDTVYVPGPGQLPLGSVVRVDSDPLSPAVTLRIVSAVNLFSTTMVELRTTGITGVTFATSTLP